MGIFSEQIRAVFSAEAEKVAREDLEKLKHKGGLIGTEEEFLNKKKEEVLNLLDSEISAECDFFPLAGSLIHEKLPLLSPVEKTKVEEELNHAMGVIGSFYQEEETPFQDKGSLQEVFGFSSDTLKWIYGIGYDFYQNEEVDKALSLFKLLTTMNSYIFDFRVAEALALEALGEDDKALESFAMAILLKPDHPIPRYHSAEIYLRKGQIKDAKVELELLEEIIQEGNLSDLQNAFKELQARIQGA